jgi:hypothetical protein
VLLNIDFNIYQPTQQRKSHLSIPRKGTERDLRPNIHIHVYVSDLYIPMIGPHKGRPMVRIYKSLIDT